MIKLAKFEPDSEDVQRNISYVLEHAPVMNLTKGEVMTTLRLVRLHAVLASNKYQDVYVARNDARLDLCDYTDRFLALLLECEQCGELLGTRRCRQRFGRTAQYWRKIAHECEIVTTASAINDYGGYAGRGWELAPNIVTLRRWIVENSKDENIKKLKV